MSGKDTAAKVAREPRHHYLERAVEDLRSAVEELEALKNRIGDEATDKPPTAETTTRSLATVLDLVPKEINEQVEGIRALTSQIRSLIF